MFFDTEVQRALRANVQTILRAFPDEYWMEKDRDEVFPHEFYRAFAEAGYLGASVPEAYGGAGLLLSDVAAILQEVSESGAGLTGASAVHMSMFGIAPLVKYAHETLRAEVLPRILDGSLHVCFGVTEPDAGTDTTRITTMAARDGDDLVIRGRKVWISKAIEADECLMLVRTTRRTEAARPTEGMSLILVPMTSPGISVSPIPMLGRRAIRACEMVLDDVRVPASRLVGEEGKGFRYLLESLNAERILVAYEAVGLGRAALRKAISYAKERVVFSRAIGANQGVQLPLAESHARLEAADLAARKAAWTYDAGHPCGPEANIAKYLASEAAYEAADRALQTLGGFGYANEYHVERYFREARLWRVAPVSQNLILSFLAERVLGLPRSF